MNKEKYIVYFDSETEDFDQKKASEDDYWDDVHEFNKWTFVRKFLFGRGFRIWLLRTIQYALRHHECWRGTGASDVIIFQSRMGNIFKRNEK